MTREPLVYGRVRHPDHKTPDRKTIVLPDWHPVHLSAEVVAPSVVFLD